MNMMKDRPVANTRAEVIRTVAAVLNCVAAIANVSLVLYLILSGQR